MTLENWLANNWLKKHQTSAQEISDLFQIFERNLKDSKVGSVSTDTRLSVAYNACLQCAIIALHASGYRTSGEGHHGRAIDSLKFAINPPDDLIGQLNGFRKKRINSTYNRAGVSSEQEIKEAIALAGKLKTMVTDWLKKNHPDLTRQERT